MSGIITKKKRPTLTRVEIQLVHDAVGYVCSESYRPAEIARLKKVEAKLRKMGAMP